jgi:hypothetical protein
MSISFSNASAGFAFRVGGQITDCLMFSDGIRTYQARLTVEDKEMYLEDVVPASNNDRFSNAKTNKYSDALTEVKKTVSSIVQLENDTRVDEALANVRKSDNKIAELALYRTLPLLTASVYMISENRFGFKLTEKKTVIDYTKTRTVKGQPVWYYDCPIRFTDVITAVERYARKVEINGKVYNGTDLQNDVKAFYEAHGSGPMFDEASWPKRVRALKKSVDRIKRDNSTGKYSYETLSAYISDLLLAPASDLPD